MARYDNQRFLNTKALIISLMVVSGCVLSEAKRSTDDLTACQHLRRAESRRAKALADNPRTSVRIPKCTKLGDFEPVQCMDESDTSECWCVDEYGIEVPGTRNTTRESIQCGEPENCTASNCRMFCPSGFARDARSGCSVCRCRDPCDGITCPNGQTCQQQEVNCKSEPCPPVPTCKKARSFANYCPAGLPLSIDDSVRPFLCGLDAGKPTCPPLYQCMVEPGNDYGVCCPNSLKFKKPGVCPNPELSRYSESTGYMCGTPCSHDLECRHMEKCCFTKGCQMNCQQPFNVTTCHQARALSDILAISEREGRGYVPDCNGPGGMFSPKQCSRNGLVCWCVDPRTGHKIKGTMGAAGTVDCENWENMIARSLGRSLDGEQCDTNICAAVCEYGFKNDHNGCPTCECSEPCDGFKCPMGSHCEVARDSLCSSGSALCSSWPVCKPDLVYSNPCDIGTPLTDNVTGEVSYCFEEERQSRAFQPTSFFDVEEPKEGRAMTNRITCPNAYKCTKLHKESERVCCPVAVEESVQVEDIQQGRQQTMCEYLRDFSERMEGTEEGMQLAIPPPRCTSDGSYESRQCALKKIKVTRAEQRKILEENTIRRMRMILSTRSRRDVESLKLFRVDDSLLNVRAAAPSMGRSAKVIDVGNNKHQGLGELFESDTKKVAPAARRPANNENELVEMDVEECWCVDGFGTEIPKTRGFNVTDEQCVRTRESIDCLDLTCRMGCEYGFNLDPETRCPACQCRDPCDGVDCGEAKECRTVDVSCEDEYCSPVPACLPRKPGQCPFLVPPGSENSDSNTCDYECRTDSHCDGAKRCCSNGCGTQCVEPQMKTACQHLQAIQRHQASEIGIPAKQMYIAQCDETTGKWKEVQCGPDNICWCVNERGEEISGTRVRGKSPICKANSALNCPMMKCIPCEQGYKVDANGCRTCECRNLCDEVSCAVDEECQLISVECVDQPCPKMPICVPRRESVCPEGSPLKQGDLDVGCGPHNENEVCPTTHTCQLNPVTHRGVCCTKTRDVCFESMDNSCLARSESANNMTKWRFNPKANKCVPVVVAIGDAVCQNKNLFHSESACNSVCPVLTQCERLKLKNSLAARKTGAGSQSSVWFQPRCDPITGHWSPVQCLGKQPSYPDMRVEGMSRAFSQSESDVKSASPYGVCWCADKKGAPLKGTLTRDSEPVCNSRQARRRMEPTEGGDSDPIMEDLIRQMTMLVDVQENYLEEEEEIESVDEPTDSVVQESAAVTEKLLEVANSILDSKLSVESTRQLVRTTSRCRALAASAPFPVSCDENGAFAPTQCSKKQCWCVDAAGNQLPSTETFLIGSKKCTYTPIASVAVELHLQNQYGQNVKNLYDILKMELHHLVGDSVENLRVQENLDGSVIVRFELHNEDKIETAFALEETIKQEMLVLGNGQFKPDITTSHFVHRGQQPIALATASTTESTLQVVVFVLATSSAFLVSIFVVFIMLKRGKRKSINNFNYPENKIIGCGDKYVDYSSPIFVLSANENDSIKPNDKGQVGERL